MKCFSLFLKSLLAITILFSIMGCQEERSFIIEKPLDLINPDGLYQTVLYRGINKAMEAFDLTKYKGKTIVRNFEKITDGYTDNVGAAIFEQKLGDAGAKVLFVGSSKDSTRVQKMKNIAYDFELELMAPIAGIYTYQGFIKRHYTSRVLLKLTEKDKEGHTSTHSSELIEVTVLKFIPSFAFVIAFWVAFVGFILILVTKFVLRNRQ